MNKAELIEALAAKTSVDKKQVENILDTFEALVYTTLKTGGEVTLTGFGTFSAKVRGARMGVNPQKPSEKIQVPAVTVPKFKAGKNFKEALKNSQSAEETPVIAEPTPEPVSEIPDVQ